MTLKIPRSLYERLKGVIDGSSYRSVNEFVVYVLRDLVAEKVNATSESALTQEEIALIRKRLHRLGYL
ncbi:MAG TPA: CopG family transcriptional regulator [Candidatus Acetothermia bacterium]|nr:CopG family transcriptional regulator [Candidatus Acetothermia bacterium]